MPLRWGIVMSATITSGLSLPARLDQLAAVLHHAYQVELRGQQALERLRDHQVVVREEHARTAQKARQDPSSVGTHAMTVVP